MNTFLTKLKEKNTIAKDVFSLKFEKPKEFTYKAGQFVQWIIKDENKNTLRSYSLSSTPEDNYIEFCIKYVEGGKASELIKRMDIGYELEFQGPQGRFTTSGEEPSLFLIATGAGLAPIIGIIEDELKNKKITKKIHLLFGVRHKEDIFWLDRLSELKFSHKNFNFDICLSQAHENWKGLSGHVTDHLNNHSKDHHYFLCGNLEMVKDVRIQLTKDDVESKHIHFEIF